MHKMSANRNSELKTKLCGKFAIRSLKNDVNRSLRVSVGTGIIKRRTKQIEGMLGYLMVFGPENGIFSQNQKEPDPCWISYGMFKQSITLCLTFLQVKTKCGQSVGRQWRVTGSQDFLVAQKVERLASGSPMYPIGSFSSIDKNIFYAHPWFVAEKKERIDNAVLSDRVCHTNFENFAKRDLFFGETNTSEKCYQNVQNPKVSDHRNSKTENLFNFSKSIFLLIGYAQHVSLSENDEFQRESNSVRILPRKPNESRETGWDLWCNHDSNHLNKLIQNFLNCGKWSEIGYNFLGDI